MKKADTMLMMRDISVAKKKEMGDRAITKLQKFQDDEVLFSYCQHPSVLKYVSAVAGPNLRAMHTMMINKPPDTGIGSSRHPPHQDLWYFPFRPINRIVACWAALQKMDQANGCLEVMPGTHQGDFYYHSYPNDGVVNKAYHGIHNYSTGSRPSNILFPIPHLYCYAVSRETHGTLADGGGRRRVFSSPVGAWEWAE